MTPNRQLADIEEKVRSGTAINADDCVRLYASDDLLAIGGMANRVVRLMDGRVRDVRQNPHPLRPDQLEW